MFLYGNLFLPPFITVNGAVICCQYFNRQFPTTFLSVPTRSALHAFNLDSASFPAWTDPHIHTEAY